MSDQQAPVADAVHAAEIFDLAIDTASRHGHTDLVTRLRGSRRLLSTSTVAAHIVGDTNQGKTALFNALLGRDFPSDGEITVSSGPAVAPFGTAARLMLVDANGPLDTGQLTDPGAEEAPPAQLAVFVSDASQELTATELDFLRTAHTDGLDIIFVQSKIDICPHWQEIMRLNLDRLSEAEIPVEAFAVSAVLDRAARRLAEPELADRAGFGPLIAHLERIDRAEPTTAVRSAGKTLHTVLDQLETALAERQNGLGSQAGPAELRATLAATQRRARRLREKSGRWQQVLNDGFAAITTDIEFDLKIRARSVLADAEKAIEEGDPSRNWAAFEQWLRERLVSETVQNYAQLVSSTRELGQKVAGQLGLADDRIAEPAEASAPTEVTVAIETATAFTQRGSIGRTGLAVFQRGYGGFMMFIVLTHYVAAIAVPMPFGIAAALVMGGAGFGDERKRQLEKRRSQAKTAVRNFIDQFNLHVGKDSRATLRRMQREMRDEYATRLVAAQRAVDDALQAAETALDDEEAGHRDLELIERDRQALATLRATWPTPA